MKEVSSGEAWISRLHWKNKTGPYWSLFWHEASQSGDEFYSLTPSILLLLF